MAKNVENHSGIVPCLRRPIRSYPRVWTSPSTEGKKGGVWGSDENELKVKSDI